MSKDEKVKKAEVSKKSEVKKAEPKAEIKSVVEMLFDENNLDPIQLFNEKGELVEFDQIAIIPKEEKTYAILKPIAEMEGLAADEALVFEINEPTADSFEYLALVTDIDLIDAVFDVYDKLMDEEEAKAKKSAPKPADKKDEKKKK